MRNDALIWSATGSPRPLPGTVLGNRSSQWVSVPAVLDLPLFVIVNFQAPAEPLPFKTERGVCGLNGPPKIGWGHSTWQHAAKLAEAAKVKLLLLFHHDPTRTDLALDAIVKQVRRLRPEAAAAREGQTISL